MTDGVREPARRLLVKDKGHESVYQARTMFVSGM